MRKNILIVGGTSGVGFELARLYSIAGHNICVTGRRTIDLPGVRHHYLNIAASADALASDIDALLRAFPDIHTLVYAAGFRQRGSIDSLTDTDLAAMTNVGLLVPMMLAARLKPLAPTPLKLILVTSSSQYTPRPLEPAYAATKAALGMLGASLVRDKGIGKVLVAAPSGIRTAFWDGSVEDTSTMLDPKWVAQSIIDLSGGPFKYRYAKLLRDPARIEILETLNNEFARIEA